MTTEKFIVKKEKIKEQYNENKNILKAGSSSGIRAKERVNGSSLSSTDIYSRDSNNVYYSRETVKLKIGGACFKEGGEYIGNETWKSIPSFLIGKQISFLSHDFGRSGRASCTSLTASYVYYVGLKSRGALKVGEMTTSADRHFNVYKYYLKKSVKFKFSVSKFSETFVITNP